MKYAATFMIVIFLIIAVSWFVTCLISRRRPLSRFRKILTTALLSVIGICLSNVIYFSNYYRAEKTALEALRSTEKVAVREMSGGWQFDGPGEDAVFVFYPGAKVEAEAYAPLLMKIAEQGVDGVLIDPPSNFAAFGLNTFQHFQESLSYPRWYVGGHSFGGSAASFYAGAHKDQVKGEILLAAFPVLDLHGTELLLIYGSQDRCLRKGEYEQSRNLWPENAEEYVVSGGNHSGVGCYGQQIGDGKATITSSAQQSETAQVITRFIKEH